MSSIGLVRDTVRAWVAPVMRYERHLSAVGMVCGFAIDSVTFGRIDRPGAHLIFSSYLLLAGGTIVVAHALQTRADLAQKRRLAMAAQKVKSPETTAPAQASALASSAAEAAGALPSAVLPSAGTADALATARENLEHKSASSDRWHTWLPAATQFALGGLWSGFLVFFSRSASLAASWLFLATLATFLVGNEVFRRYHSRLVFASLLLFFATYAYAILLMPVLTRSIGRATFLLSGVVAILAFLIFLQVLASVGGQRFRQSRLRLWAGAGAIAVAMNLFYFTGILPPLPLSLLRVGIYHSVKHVDDKYQALAEPQPWYATYGIVPAVMHVAPGDSLSLYSAVFAPIELNTRISHRWQWYDPKREKWTTLSTVSFPISGGRDGGYRAYTIKSKPKPGDWRVDIGTDDGRLIGRLRFDVSAVPAPAPTTMQILP
jgi:hypothetical protein